ncbi:hypothetical protein QE152_g19717 [Popillia japonica]|uniref:Uncharacterized protein n=1 Tax=Popillia japonica TaxID=7064 RepID=A0AAW1KQ01_POPJA
MWGYQFLRQLWFIFVIVPNNSHSEFTFPEPQPVLRRHVYLDCIQWTSTTKASALSLTLTPREIRDVGWRLTSIRAGSRLKSLLVTSQDRSPSQKSVTIYVMVDIN